MQTKPASTSTTAKSPATLQGPLLTLLWLTVSYSLLTLSLYQQLHPAIYGCALLTLVWRYRITLWQATPPPHWLINLLTAAGLGVLFLLWRQQGFLPAMLNLLVLGCTLKFLEFGSQRHLAWHAISLFFLCALTFIYRQSLAFTLLMTGVVVLNTLALLSTFQLTGWRDQCRVVGRLLLLSLPLLVCQFLLLPHLGPMWRMPDVKKATTGLSDTMAPGEIAELSRSSDLAFRARFDGPMPAVSQLYWRALVLEEFDGVRWSAPAELRELPSYAGSGAAARFAQTGNLNAFVWPVPSWRYQLVVEPTQRQWLFALDYSQPQEPDVYFSRYGTLYLARPLQQKRQVTLQYFPQAAVQGDLPVWQRRQNLLLPADINPQTDALVEELRLAHPDDPDLAQAMMQFFARGRFVYTLNPPLLSGANQIDDLLFATRRGFCAHFASALAYMLRHAGIPARVVTGYLGGEVDPAGAFVSVYQFNAHAWVEAWLQGRWQRLDPTLMVAPGRAEANLDQVLPADETRLRDPFSLASYSHTLLLARVHQWLTEIDYRWSVWVLNYDNQRQAQWLASLHGNNLLVRAGLMVGGLLLTLLLALLPAWWRRRHRHKDPVLATYLTACQRIANRYGLPRQAQETPQQYLHRLTALPASVWQTMRQLTEHLEAARYRQQDPAQALRQMRRLLRQLPRR